MRNRLIATWLLSAACLYAGTLDIRMDLSNLVSTTPGNWDNISNLTGTTINLIDFNTGTGSGVSISGSGNWQNFFGDDFGTFPNRDWLIQPATRDGAGLQAGLTGTFTLSGLSAGAYTVEVVSARTTFNYLNTFTLNAGINANRTELGTSVVTPWASTVDGLTPGNWLIWDNVAPVGGNITITDVAAPTTLGIINAIRISSVPEPMTFGLASLGIVLFGFAALQRRT